MTLSALIKKGGLYKAVTATPATITTLQADLEESVAQVATVAVAVKLETLPELSLDEETCIRAWLTHIEETDPDIITEVLNKCRDEQDARWYYLNRSEEVQQIANINRHVTCSGCGYFERINHHHLGHCSKGEPEAIAGLWDSDQRYCEQYQPKSNAVVKGKFTSKLTNTKAKFP